MLYLNLGLLFQITDDILDVTGSVRKMGKPIKQDKKKGKSTLVELIGLKKTLNYALNLKINILRKLQKHGKKAEDLKKTINFIVDRSY